MGFFFLSLIVVRLEKKSTFFFNVQMRMCSVKTLFSSAFLSQRRNSAFSSETGTIVVPWVSPFSSVLSSLMRTLRSQVVPAPVIVRTISFCFLRARG